VQVGDINNPADTMHAVHPGTGQPWGSVGYEFSPATTEVTNADFMNFLNSVADQADPARLYNEEMASDPRGGIVREGQTAPFAYKVKPNMANKPANFVSWLDAARYTNWLENGEPAGLQGSGTTEDGAFDLLIVQDPGVDAILSESAQTSLLTENEWYKSAFYNLPNQTYWLYPTGSDSEPFKATAQPGTGDVDNPGAEVVNYADEADWNGQDGNVTTVASAGAPSPLGTYDQAGNVAEWLADDSENGQRIARGGSYADAWPDLQSEAGAVRDDVLLDPDYEGPDVGIRVAVVPEPAGALLCGLMAIGGIARLERARGNRRSIRSQRRPRS
jgi:formylglycine-generating enzyme required for sulfatase activity